MIKRKLRATDKIAVVFITLLYFLYLWYANLITFDFDIAGDTFGFVTRITCIASFFLAIAVFFTDNRDRAFKIAFCGSLLLFIANPELGITLSLFICMFVSDDIGDIKQSLKKDKLRLFLSFWFIAVTFIQWSLSFQRQRFYLAEYYSNLHYVIVGALCFVITALFVALYKLSPKIKPQIKKRLTEKLPVLFAVYLFLSACGIYYAMLLNNLDMQMSLTLAAFAISAVKTVKNLKNL